MINNVFEQFLEDFKADRDPTVNLKAAINDLGQDMGRGYRAARAKVYQNRHAMLL
jgi:hypothetical protein